MSLENLPGIYKITCAATGKLYFGQSQNVYRRRIEHVSMLRHNQHCNKHLQNAWNLYGEEQFVFSAVVYTELSELDGIERALVLFNLQREPGHSNRGMTLSDEHKARIGEANRGHKCLEGLKEHLQPFIQRQDDFRRTPTQYQSRTPEKLWFGQSN